MTFSEAMAKMVLKELKRFDPYIISQSTDGISVYIGFNKLPAGLTHKLRISNPPERARYGYKWQIRTDGLGDHEHKKHFSRYFREPVSFIAAFRDYYGIVEFNEAVRTKSGGEVFPSVAK